MPDALTPWLTRYRRHERAADIGFWVVVMAAQLVFNTAVSWFDLRRFDPGQPVWEPLLWELTSVPVVGALIPAIVWWERRHPLRLDTLPGSLGWHLTGAVGFTVLHVLAMVALRWAAYGALGLGYRVSSWPGVLGYEFLKDVRSYGAILLAILGWRFLLLRAQGEARVLDPPEPPAGESAPGPDAPAPVVSPPAPVRPERFLVRKLRKEFLVAAAEIDWLQAQGNYLGLRVNGHDYLLRSTLADFLQQLDPARFARVHRSWAVNLDRIAEIEPLEAGDARLKMKDGSQVPCSRRYRDALAAAAGG
ncbi:LytTR family DNA-binding domain-containing protein [Ramlibacter tataouinensis]|uniref:LytTR family DNA-binding domain-containing protein n=1 Tax=Ramlibacter tataouinensis TaxID=94132 RepID=UPI0022F3B445|nr:LytTR family DNA-binding domain-containing protein [Ramlibacter tataouinensis]WBX99953.1 LytTR family DNA-binding domain-containing protein [Ramlibacter tataouinensis]